MIRKITLWLIRRQADDRGFRIDVCKELHRNAQHYFGDQTVSDRFHEACEEFFEAGIKQIENTYPNVPHITSNYIGGVMHAFEQSIDRARGFHFVSSKKY